MDDSILRENRNRLNDHPQHIQDQPVLTVIYMHKIAPPSAPEVGRALIGRDTIGIAWGQADRFAGIAYEIGHLMSGSQSHSSLPNNVQQIACCYLRHGYWFYVKGHIPKNKPAEAVDAKLIEKYGIDVSESTRARRKKSGRSNLHYIRHQSTFVILATKGDHPFVEHEANLDRDIRRHPILIQVAITTPLLLFAVHCVDLPFHDFSVVIAINLLAKFPPLR